MSLAWVDGQSLRTYRHAPNTGSRKSWAAGDATSRAVRLALIAKTGEMGYPSVLTAKTWGFYDVLFKGKPFEFQRPYGSYVMENVLFKISFPAEFHAQTAVECAMQLHPQVKDRLDDIAKITIRTHESAIRIIDKKGPLANPADRDHCIQYMVAVPLIYGRLTAADYEDGVAADPRIDALRDKMVCVEDKQFTQGLPRSRQALDRQRDHRRVQATARKLAGSRRRVSDRPSRAGARKACRVLVEKFRTNLARRFPGEAAAGDPRRRARREAARSDAGARVRRPDGRSDAPRRRASPPMPSPARRSPCALAALAAAATAQDFPKLKPGLWEMTHDDRRAPEAASRAHRTMCLDDSVQQDMYRMSHGHDGGPVQQARRQGQPATRSPSDAVCKLGEIDDAVDAR